ncbi:Right origin-binding protein [Thalassocella blandensis]|nr:Right origin-binding protein [Thalassocella blandensis]
MERIFRSVDFIEGNLYEDISIQDIACASNLSTHHFCRKFKCCFGESPVVYLRKRRMTLAAKALIEEKEEILSIALNLQFNSQEAFTRAFKAHFNRTPARYRKMGDALSFLFCHRIQTTTCVKKDV